MAHFRSSLVKHVPLSIAFNAPTGVRRRKTGSSKCLSVRVLVAQASVVIPVGFALGERGKDSGDERATTADGAPGAGPGFGDRDGGGDPGAVATGDLDVADSNGIPDSQP